MRLEHVIRGTALAGALYTTAAHAQGAPEAPVADAAARRELREQATAARTAGRPSREARAMTSAGVMPVAGGVLVHVGGAL